MLRRLFGKEKTRDDKLTEAVRVITGLLDNQASFAQMQNLSMKDEQGNLNAKRSATSTDTSTAHSAHGGWI